MLVSAATQQQTNLEQSNVSTGKIEPSVSLNLLSQQDLQQLKQQQTRSESASQSNHTEAKKYEKKYIILTFQGEFDKVHYPLPLKYLEEPEMD